MSKDIPGGGARPGERAAQASGGPVQEDDGGGQGRSNSSGAFPAWHHQTLLHAVEGQHELHQHSGLQDRRHQGDTSFTSLLQQTGKPGD